MPTRDPLREAVRSADEALRTISELIDSREAPPAQPLITAQRLHHERRARDAQFPNGLFGEPAWDMLLALFIAGEQGEKIGVSKVWAAGGVGSGTGVRVLERLEEQGLVERDRHPGRRIQYLSLTGSARQQMIEYLESIG